MLAFRMLLIAIFGVLTIYTLTVGAEYGWDILSIFFRDIAAVTWPGQFNLDFLGFLILSGLWVSWRNNFSVVGLVLGIVAFFGGIMFLAPYLFYLSFATKGDIKKTLLGQIRAID